MSSNVKQQPQQQEKVKKIQHWNLQNDIFGKYLS